MPWYNLEVAKWEGKTSKREAIHTACRKLEPALSNIHHFSNSQIGDPLNGHQYAYNLNVIKSIFSEHIAWDLCNFCQYVIHSSYASLRGYSGYKIPVYWTTSCSDDCSGNIYTYPLSTDNTVVESHYVDALTFWEAHWKAWRQWKRKMKQNIVLAYLFLECDSVSYCFYTVLSSTELSI